MRLKKIKKYKTQKLQFRCTETEHHDLVMKAMLLTDGNLSEYLRYAALNFEIEKDDLENAPREQGANN